MAINVVSTNQMTDLINRHEALAWVNDVLKANYMKIEDLCSGVAHCQLVNLLFPGTINIKKIKVNTNLEHEYIINFKLVQAAFETLNINKLIPVEKLVKGRFQDNFEFIQWFKRFYDINCASGRSNDQQISKPNSVLKNPKSNLISKPNKKSDSVVKSKLEPVRTSTSYLEEMKSYNSQIEEMRLTIDSLEIERDFYYDKLRDIEAYCHEADQDENPIVPAIYDILYAKADGFVYPEEIEADYNS